MPPDDASPRPSRLPPAAALLRRREGVASTDGPAIRQEPDGTARHATLHGGDPDDAGRAGGRPGGHSDARLRDRQRGARNRAAVRGRDDLRRARPGDRGAVGVGTEGAGDGRASCGAGGAGKAGGGDGDERAGGHGAGVRLWIAR